MVSNILTSTVIGLDAYKILVETDTNNSLPGVTIVGLPDAAVSEAKERVRSAIKNSGFTFPTKKIIINLAPADIRKEGTNYDLPIAIGILAKDGLINEEDLKNTAFIGELSLDGSIRPVNGILPIVSGLKELNIDKIFVPFENRIEAAIINNVKIYPVKTLSEVVYNFMKGHVNYKPVEPFKIDIQSYINELKENDKELTSYDFKDVKGQTMAKKAMEIAAAGGHNLLMVGSPGSGKTLLSKCFNSILPPLTLEEAIELTKIYSVSGLLHRDKPLIYKRPFRAVHHLASSVGIIGGGSNPKPGEITLAHRGVLFLDEIVEFPRNVLEVLRQPLEDGEVTISRAQTSVKYPSDFMLLAAMNPCPCGFLGDKEKKCTCGEYQIKKYRSRLSGPLLDRIDLQIEVPRLTVEELTNYNDTQAESSSEIKKRVIKAHEIQAARYKGYGILTNSQLTPKLVKKFCKMTEDCEPVLKMAISKFQLSGRAYDRLLKITRTIADLANDDIISSKHIAQALQFRNFIYNDN